MRTMHVALLLLLLPTLAWAADAKPARVNAADFPNLQAAVDALPEGGGEVVLPPGNYVLDKTLDLTGRNTRPRDAKYPHSGDFITLTGSGMLNTTLVGKMKDQPVVDLTDSTYVTMRDLKIVSDTANIGLLLARETGNGGCNGFFTNVMVDGSFSVAGVYCLASEVCRWYNCYFIQKAKDGVGFIIAPVNYWKVKSPYHELTAGCSNTEFKFYGCTWAAWGGGKCVDLWVCGPSTSDLAIYGGYFSATGLTGILLDGTHGGGRVGAVSIEGVRIEGERAEHCLLARGLVDNVRVHTGEWVSGSAEPISYEPGGAGRLWEVSGLGLVIYDGIYVKYAPGADNYRMVRFESPLRDSKLEILDNYPTLFTKNAKGDFEASYPRGKSVVLEAGGSGNEFTVARREDLVVKGEDSGNVVRALEDGGVTRTYQGSGGLPALLNLSPCDVTKLPNPKLGDLAVDSGINTADHQPGPMFYDGKKWRALSLTP
ncbi:MAG TPA: hypothetical protein VGM19_13050 [Armatimonadota bacterium]|jgi:hypothetical protein